MRQGKAKLIAFLMTIGCLFAGASVGATVAPSQVQNDAVNAEAEAEVTVHNLGKLAVHNNSSGSNSNTPKVKELYMKIAGGKDIPYPDENWETEFALESGAGWTLNGVDVNAKVSDLESTNGGLYVNVENAGVQIGDTLSVEGTFYSADVNAKYVIAQSKFTWDGAKWQKCVEYTTHQVGEVKFSAWTAGSNFIYLKRVDGKSFAIPSDGNNGWSATFQHKDGVGVTVNGTQVATGNVKFPARDMFINLSSALSGSPKAPVVGDILTIGGTFYNANMDLEYVVEESKFVWNGTAWETYYEVYDLGELIVQANSNGSTTNTPAASQMYLKRKSGSVPIAPDHWNTKFTLESGDGWKLNGNPVTVGDLVSTSGLVFFNVSNANVKVGDVLSVSGTFKCEAEKAKYTISESKFVWNGTAWEEYVANYTTHQIGAIKFQSWTAGSNHIYLNKVDGTAMPEPNDGNNGWTATFRWKDGVGVTINGKKLKGENIKFPGGSMFINIKSNLSGEPKAPVTGDILTVGGTFYNTGLGVQYVIEENSFIWNGSTWETYYTPHELGALTMHESGGAKNAIYLKRADGGALAFEAWENKFTLESGDGVKVNGAAVELSDMQSSPAGLYLAFADLQAVSVLTISGTFVCETQKVKYEIDESKFVWDGTAWRDYDPCVVHELGQLVVHDNSNGSNTSVPKATHLYMKLANGTIPYKDSSWDTEFALESGAGWKLNGESITVEDIESTDNGLYVPLTGVEVGDVLSVEGTFYSADVNAKYVIAQSKFTWNGTAWEMYVDYETHEIGSLTFKQWDAGSNFIYFSAEKSIVKPNDTNNGWTATFAHKNGVGVTLNGVQVAAGNVKFPSGQMFVNVTSCMPEELVEGDVLVIGGTFYNTELRLQYVVEETTFFWTGTTWKKYVEYTTHELGALAFKDVEADKQVSFNSASSVAIPTDAKWLAYTLESGHGVTLNGAAVGVTVKFPGRVFLEFVTAPKAYDKLTIGGVFYNESAALKYVIEETTFWYNGTAWVTQDPTDSYTEHRLGEMAACSPSSKVGDAKATQLYLKPVVGTLPYPDANWETEFAYKSGNGVRLNGQQIKIVDLESSNSGLFLQLKDAGVQKGDILTIGGTYVCHKESATYIITESCFMWNGEVWIGYVDENELEAYDVISLNNVGLGTEQTFSGTVDQYTGLAFVPSAENTTNSVVFRFGYRSADTAAGTLCIRLCGSAWQGVKFWISNGNVVIVDANKSYPLASNTDYVIELGAVCMTNGKIWTFAKLNGVLVLSQAITTSQFNEFKDYPTTGLTSHFSLYASDLAETKLTDEGNLTITFVSSAGTYKQFLGKESALVLPTGKTTATFIGWAYNGKLYQAGADLGILAENATFTAVEIDFTMLGGAAIRLAGSGENAGIRFTSMIDVEDWNALLENYDVAAVNYGTLIMPYDFLGAGQKPNLEEFAEDTEILNIDGEKGNVENGYLVIRGAMKNLYAGNYGRLFAGRAYVEIVLEGGESWIVYAPFNSEDNVRSIRQIAIAFKADTSAPEHENDPRYSTLTSEQKAVVDGYVNVDGIRLMNYDAYEANATSIIAWNYPALNPANNYMNDDNVAIADQMKAAGIKIVGLTGQNMVILNNALNIEKTRQIIQFFGSQGLMTFAFAANTGGIKDGGAYGNLNVDLSQSGYPDFSDCEGFMGFLAWDEPSTQQAVMDKIADFAKEFEKKYAGTDVIFMANLLPSYASYFNTREPGWGQSNMDVLDKEAFKAYLQQYCDTVLSQVSGVKWLSLDTYPINSDASLLTNFLFDLAMLKYYAEANDAHSHVVLQSSGWKEGSATSKERIPTEEEMRMQAYAAMAFGIDSFSWFTYSPSHMSATNQYYTPVDQNGVINEEAYEAFTAVNEEITAIGKVYNAFTWKGVILGAGKNNGSIIINTIDKDYEAYAAVQGQIGDYELSANDTKYLASVATNKTSWNYLMGVMEDAHGNEGYVLCNYNSHESDRTQTITIKFDANITEVVIYRGGVAQTVSVSDKTLQVSLATGEGVIILPSKLG